MVCTVLVPSVGTSELFESRRLSLCFLQVRIQEAIRIRYPNRATRDSHHQASVAPMFIFFDETIYSIWTEFCVI